MSVYVCIYMYTPPAEPLRNSQRCQNACREKQVDDSDERGKKTKTASSRDDDDEAIVMCQK